jgi:hypothetical protein
MYKEKSKRKRRIKESDSINGYKKAREMANNKLPYVDLDPTTK